MNGLFFGLDMQRKDETGLFASVRETIDQTLGVCDYTSKTAALDLKNNGYGADTADLVPELFKVIERNWNAALQTVRRSHSLENFRWRFPQTQHAQHNRSPEVTLERALIGALLAAGRKDWSNQVPIISGIAGPHAFKRRAIDLVHQRADSSFEFIELKIDSDTSIYAAIEILVYGLLWLLSRRDVKILDYKAGDILNAQELSLSVLAPQEYYRRYSVVPLAKAINDGLHQLGDQHGVTMSFRFTAFPRSFSWPRNPGEAPIPSDEDLIGFLDRRETV
jgi:hypothetical protein